jgi:hypothetical protein
MSQGDARGKYAEPRTLSTTNDAAPCTDSVDNCETRQPSAGVSTGLVSTKRSSKAVQNAFDQRARLFLLC